MASQVVHELNATKWKTQCALPVADPIGQYVTMTRESGFVNCPTCLAVP